MLTAILPAAGAEAEEGPATPTSPSENCEICQASLLNSDSGLGLAFLLKTPASDPDMSAQISSSDAGLHYHYSTVPDSERLYFDTPTTAPQPLGYALVARTTTIADDKGTLSNTAPPEDMPISQSKHLLEALKKGLNKLLSFKPEAFALLDNRTPVLVVSNPQQTTVTFYSTAVPVRPLFEFMATAEGEENICTFDDIWQVPDTHTGIPDPAQAPAPSQKALEVVSVQVVQDQEALQQVLGYLKDLYNIAGNKKVRSRLLKLIYGGELSWQANEKTAPPSGDETPPESSLPPPKDQNGESGKQAAFHTEREHRTITLPKTQFRAELLVGKSTTTPTVVNLSALDNMDDALANIDSFLTEAKKGNYSHLNIDINNVASFRILLHPDIRQDVVDALKNANTDCTEMNQVTSFSDEVERDGRSAKRHVLVSAKNADSIRHIRSAVILPHRIQLRQGIQSADLSQLQPVPAPVMAVENQSKAIELQKPFKKPSSNKPPSDLFKKNIHSFAAHAAVGGGISAGIHIYDHYQQNNTLPHQYSWKEWKDFSLKMLHDTTRYGISGVIVQNLVDAGVPPLAAGAAIGAVNTLYDNYFSGKPPKGMLPALADAGATSVISGAGAYVGRTAVSFIPTIGRAYPAQATGSLVGSFTGHMIYQRIADYSARHFQ